MNKRILLIGGGGHCKSVLDSLLELNEYTKIGIVDKKEKIGKLVMGTPVVGCDDDLPALFKGGYGYAFVTVGSIGNPTIRVKLFSLIVEIGYEIPVIIDGSAIVSNYAKINTGAFIGKQTIINAGAHIKEGSIINSGAIVEHDCQIGAFSHIAPGVVLGGEAVVGEKTHIGSNATVKQQVIIGSNSIIGMGSVVLQNIDSNTMAYGNPCKEVKKL
jgi:sugar O-acyltransferase (sialic acid O-acetyltransferase NeuD family)